MMEKALRYCHRWFEVPGAEIRGKFTVQGGSLPLETVGYNQYYLIEGSVYNDGLHRKPDDDLIDEEFNGVIYPLAIPRAFQDVVARMEAWQVKNGDPGVYQSESFGGYSYTRATGKNGTQATVFDAFASDLKPFRKLQNW